MTDSVKRRQYRSAVRDEQAGRTRDRILEAAAALFERDGYGTTSIKSVAARAEVAPDTVYAVFGSKERLLTALIDDRLSAGSTAPNVLDRTEFAAIRDEPDQRVQVHAIGRFVAVTWPRVGPIYEILRTAQDTSPALATVFREMDGYRFVNMRRLIDWVAAHGPLHSDAEQAAETLFAIASPDVSRLLRLGRGWTQEEHATWLGDTLERLLLPES